MLKKLLFPTLTLLLAFNLNAQAQWRKNVTMLLVPRESQTIQVAQDISRRYPVLIVCYQQNKSSLNLHAWNGENWVKVSEEDYQQGSFFSQSPAHVILVESETAPAPKSLIPDGTWCDSGNRLVSEDPRVIIHLLGRYFDFPYRYWMQFAQRYTYQMDEINPALLNIHKWQTLDRRVFPKDMVKNKTADLDQWFFLEITQPIEPILVDEEPESIPPAETPSTDPEDSSVIVPLEDPAEKPEETVPVQAAEPVLTESEQLAQDISDLEELAETIDALNALDAMGSTEPSKPLTEEIPVETPVETEMPFIETVDPFSIEEMPPATVILPPVQ